MALLLDTCALIWTSLNQPLARPAREAIERDMAQGGNVFVSPISAWELGLLSSASRIVLTTPPARWFHLFVNRRGVALASMTPEILIAASFLPGALHRDPADRILCATARECGLTIVTRDRKILDYAAAGHCRGLAC